ncbi:hypothetical protein B0H11DRAFT_2202693 [Mycena galericulata]|nr:hypothetical protein B0H11DRAFT_2202693 [Mycena galericulata]
MASPPSSAAPDTMKTLRSTIIPALNLAKAGVAGIGIPGVEGALNAVHELAKMISTMKGNKKDLDALKKSIDAFATLEVPGAPTDLEKRLTELSVKMTARSEECKALGTKSRIDRFLRSDMYSSEISDIRNGVASDIHEFTFHGNISIEILVTDITWKVGVIDGKVNQVIANNTLGRLKCSAARYNADNTPDKCMDGTRTDIIKEILAKLTAPPNADKHLVILMSQW